jgi:hypothetical protein
MRISLKAFNKGGIKVTRLRLRLALERVLLLYYGGDFSALSM